MAAGPAARGLLYYEGHGVQIGGVHQLLPLAAAPAGGKEGAGFLHFDKLAGIWSQRVVTLLENADNPGLANTA